MKWIKTEEKLPEPFTDILFLYCADVKYLLVPDEWIPFYGYFDNETTVFSVYNNGVSFKQQDVIYWCKYPKFPVP